MASDAGDQRPLRLFRAIDGNTGRGGTTHKESVYVFRTSDGGVTYGQVAMLIGPDAAAGYNFGWSRASKTTLSWSGLLR